MEPKPSAILHRPLAVGSASPVESGVWALVDGLWLPLYGGFTELGVSIEWHEFRVDTPLEWSRSFHPNSLEICLNFTGAAELNERNIIARLQNDQIAIYTIRDGLVEAVRQVATIHRFITVELSPDYLRSQFTDALDGVQPRVRKFLDNPDRFTPWIDRQTMPLALLALRQQLLDPPVSGAALSMWYAGKIQEILAQTLFRKEKAVELFCHRHKRINAERIERVKFLLDRDVCNPPSLDMLGREVDCSPFYLSRLFAEQLGTSIPKYLRDRRIEKAAELIVTRGESVTTAAMAVGYSSLSAFNKAFVTRFGKPPGSYRKDSI